MLYTLPLGAIIKAQGLQYHCYVDDTQVYSSLPLKDPQQMQETLVRMETCLSDIRKWMLENKLKLNDTKTECAVFASKSNQSLLPKDFSVRIGESSIRPSPNVRNLGAHLDSTMTMEHHVNISVRSAYYHLRRISKIRCHLTESICAKAVISTVISRLDYHNGLLVDISQKVLRRMQVVQNNAARLVTQTPSRAHITPVLSRLHWLPVEQRVQYKVMLAVHKALYCPDSPHYLRTLIHRSGTSRPLRSTDTAKL